jgi:hypothetical protein
MSDGAIVYLGAHQYLIRILSHLPHRLTNLSLTSHSDERLQHVTKAWRRRRRRK